ncbi:MAG: isoprenylcysteine carboxylmethyltransferase family protein [bacterium]|nr:isoprenylcysteine carboxylmethyltransferase family protein [bacterium]
MTWAGHRERWGHWLCRHRGWGLIPLLVIGLLLERHILPASRGSYMLIAGAAGILFGALLRVVCSTFISHHESHDSALATRLITDGPYAISRNPAYLGEGAIALGIAMMSRMPWFVLVTLGGLFVLMAFIIEWEEKALRDRFGQEYDNYSRLVPRWFSFSQMLHPDSYLKTRGRVKLLTAVRAEAGTMLIGLSAILAFLAKADLEILQLSRMIP